MSLYKKLNPEQIQFVTTLIIAHGNKQIASKTFWHGDSDPSVQKIPVIYVSKECGYYLSTLMKSNKVEAFLCKPYEGGKFFVVYIILNPYRQ